jgi:GDP-4-dehydro-6-deoxy-D-mannose reductase
MRALILGADGFVGGHLAQHLAQSGDEVFLGMRKHPQGGHSDSHCLTVDITDPATLSDAFRVAKPEVVYHLAGIAFVPEAEEDFERVLRVNVAGTSNVARECHRAGGGVSLVFVSSAEVYGAISSTDLPITEATPVRPANNYSLSKRMAELVVERYGRVGTIKCSIARPFNHIGAGQNERFVTASFALQLARIAHRKEAPILRVGNLEARRDFSDVRDIVRAYRLLALGGAGVFNLGSGRAVSIQFILDTLISIAGVSVQIERDPQRMRGPEVPEVYGSCRAVSNACGWIPEITIQRSLEDVYRYWYDRVASGLA